MKLIKTSAKRSLIIGDVHGDDKKLFALMEEAGKFDVQHYIFLGDLVDRGPNPHLVLRIVEHLVETEQCTVLMGNHDWKFVRHFRGQTKVSMKEEQQYTLKTLHKEDHKRFSKLFGQEVVGAWDPELKLMLGHAAAGKPTRIFEKAAARLSNETKVHMEAADLHSSAAIDLSKNLGSRFLYGITNGSQVDERGYPVRLTILKSETDSMHGWKFIHGHTHAKEFYPEGHDGVICLDWACGEEGGRLAGLFVPEDGTISEDNLILI